MKINDITNDQVPEHMWNAALSIMVGSTTSHLTTEEYELLRNRQYPEIEQWVLTMPIAYVSRYAYHIFRRNRWIEAEPILRTNSAFFYDYIDRLRMHTTIPNSFRKFYNEYNKSMGFDV